MVQALQQRKREFFGRIALQIVSELVLTLVRNDKRVRLVVEQAPFDFVEQGFEREFTYQLVPEEFDYV